MKKVTILALHLGYGGIEKCICSLANSLVDKYKVEIVSVYKLYDESAFDIDSRVSVRYLIPNLKPNREEWKESLKKFKIFKFIKESFFSVLTLYRRHIYVINEIKNSDSDIIISTRILFNKWLGKYGSKSIKKVGWEHNHHHGNEKYIKNMISSCRDLDSIVFVSDSLKCYYAELLNEKKYKCKPYYIPNSLDLIPSKCSKLDTNDIISVGRFSREKGFVDLIEVFNKIHEKDPSLKLHLVGDGTQRNMIVDKIYQYGLQDSVIVYGFLSKEKINEILSRSSLYLMTSYTESFGIVLLEAMSFGIPCIAFSSAEGACDLIKDSKNGFLIDNRDFDKMADKVIEVMKDNKLRKSLGKEAKDISLNYSSEFIKDEWIKILK